jgi:C-terminal processing protease CtpA/Prc
VIARPLVEFDLAKGGAFDFPHTAGNIGARLLEQFNITLDYSRKQAFFEKNARFGQPTLWDRSGLWLNQDGTSFAVIDVTAGGPAALVGLGVGDTVIAVNGRPASQFTLSDLRLLLRQSLPGSHVQLTIQSKGAATSHDVVLVLKELV